ncbi:MAG: UvrD-helicase domain-containing protein [Candidatus Omnitrophica bacterium]|nr:UvrD-helicase domain-containing protein [Candidatus Omnitrophota bacterium]
MKYEPTKSQRLAAQHGGENILVSAGAGTGKTSVLVARFLNFVISKKALVTEILALTFTEKAANEIKRRIREGLAGAGQEAEMRKLESAYISTIHAFAARILKEHPLEAGVNPDFRVIEEEEMDFLAEQALDEILEIHCQKGSEVFELLHVYGERKIKDGVRKVFEAARQEGKTLAEFFNHEIFRSAQDDEKGSAVILRPKAEESRKVFELLAQLGEEKLAGEFKRFEKLKSWDWQAIEDFRLWFKDFSKRGKGGIKETWKEISSLCKKFLTGKIEILAGPWKEKFEKLALLFEGAYEKKKKAEGVLDFDDLEILALKLFRKKDKISGKILLRYREKFRQIMVDEFQDTNRRQLDLIELLASGDNLFFVGDYKQSIYAFRGAEASLFLEKEKAYLTQKSGMTITLAENFRTGETVLEWINLFFQNLWAEDGFSYEPLAAFAEKHASASPELLLINPKEGESLAASRMREASMIADKILGLAEEGVLFGDMAILFQAMTDTGLYEQALKRKGIPYYVISGRGFYHQPEIRDMISFLSFLENPLADIPLAASLRSPLFQLKDDTLFWLAHRAKQNDKREESTPLYEGVKVFEDIAEIPETEKQKIRFFLTVAGELAAVKDRLKLPELLDFVLARTSYELTLLAGPQGVRKYANLKKLISLARQFESAEPLAMADFLRTIRRLETREVREAEAQIEAEESGRVVRLLSVHAAKGLEFPVVFVADLGRAKQSPESKTIIAKAAEGYSLRVRNELTLEEEQPAGWEKINAALQRKDKEERKRLFYVALTRAKHRLILSGVRKEKKKENENFHEMSSWMDWLMAMPECLEKLTVHEDGGDFSGRAKQPLAERKIMQEVFGDFTPQPAENFLKTKSEREKIESRARQILAQIVPAKRIPGRVIDLPVSAYALYQKDPAAYRRVYEIGYPNLPVNFDENEPEWFSEEEGTNAADFGTAVHRVLEKLDFANAGKISRDWLEFFFRGMEERTGEAEKILKNFAASPVFKKLQQAKAVYRELPFVLNERHGLIYGVIDLLFQDARGHWYVLDYKTAVGSADKIASSGYDLQIQIYALAVSRILGKIPDSGMIYFLKNNYNHEIPFDEKALADFGIKLRQIQEEILGLGAANVL